MSKRTWQSIDDSNERLQQTDVTTVYIHGIGNHPPADVWKGQWDLALFGKPMGSSTRGAYWADVLHPDQTETFDADSATDNPHASFAEMLAGTVVDPFDSSAALFAEKLGQAMTGTSGSERVRSTNTEIVPLPERWRRRFSRFFLETFIRDTAAYFFDENARREIKQRLVDQIPDDGSPYVLVSHSQGTIVAFEMLMEMNQRERENVSLFVTLGSPLGIQEIQNQLGHDDVPIQYPSGIGGWHNFANRFDPVALDNRLGNDYLSDGVDSLDFVQDHTIVNPSLWQLAKRNPHDSAGYLSDPEVREVVYRALNFDSTGRFVVARDVAHGFAARGERQPVLIEALEPNYNATDESDTERSDREEDMIDQNSSLNTLAGRIEHLANEVRRIVRDHAGKGLDESELKSAHVQRLRKYVAARLTAAEIEELARSHAAMNVYAMWRSATKKKLIDRSHRTIGADAARASFKSMGGGITWAVLDTGCRFHHPHFKRNRKRNGVQGNSLVIDVLDCTTDSDNPIRITDEADSDIDGHGTHVSGVISGRGSVGDTTYYGVAPKTRLLVYKVLNDHGVGEDAWIIKAIDDIFRRNENSSGLAVHGVNLSLGGAFDATVYGCGFSPICQALRELWRQGVLVCVAAGNEGQIQVSTLDGPFDLNTTRSIGDPANLEDCIAVGSVNTDKPYLYGISHFSSRGPTTDGRVKPDVVAPGERITSCSNDYATKPYRRSSGTSMACPHVSGLLAAFLSVRREFIGRPDEVKEILFASCNDIGRDRNHQGRGIPNLLKMLTET